MTRYIFLISVLGLFLRMVSQVVTAETLQDKLYTRTLKSKTCEQIPNNGRYCKYTFGDFLEIGIKDVGSTNTVVGFHLSDIQKELYATMYLGCIAVVPGKSHPRNYDKDYGIFISPKTGLVYRSIFDCQKAT
jgi:hypothetical protein